MKMNPHFLWIFPLLLLGHAQAEDIKAGPLVFETTDAWTAERPNSSMRAAQLRFDVEDVAEEDDPLVVFFYFGPSNGGGAPANIERWQGQFEGGPESQEIINLDTDATVDITELTAEQLNAMPLMLVLSGTFMESMTGAPFAGPKTPMEGYRMLGAILPHAQGSVFVKMTAPEEIADKTRAAFMELMKTALD